MSILEANHVSFSYGTNGGRSKSILDDVSLSVDSGCLLGLLGPNGAGKSTLMAVLAGDYLPDKGSVKIGGRVISSYSRRELARLRAVMLQSSTFPFAYLVRDIVRMGRTSWNTSVEENEEIVSEALEAAGVVHLSTRDVTTLSGGEQARVTFARVIAQQARIVFLDEPTAALDIAYQERTMELCRELASRGCAVVAVMHDLELAAGYCDRLALMSEGKIAQYGTPEKVLDEELLSYVYRWPLRVGKHDGQWLVTPSRKERSRLA